MTYAETAIEVIKKTLLDIRPELVKQFGSTAYDLKHDKSKVTQLDMHVEQLLKRALKVLDSSVGFYGEEFGIEGSKERFWLIDPIDGTEAFVRGLPLCTNMLCLIENNKPSASVIYNFVLDDFYSAIEGRGAFKNNQPIRVSNRPIEEAAIEAEIELLDQKHQDIVVNMPGHAFYRFWCAGYGLSKVAEGNIEARVMYHALGKMYDFVPGALLVKEAGGKVTNIGVKTYDYKNLDMIVSNSVVHEDLQNYFKMQLSS